MTLYAGVVVLLALGVTLFVTMVCVSATVPPASSVRTARVNAVPAVSAVTFKVPLVPPVSAYTILDALISLIKPFLTAVIVSPVCAV